MIKIKISTNGTIDYDDGWVGDKVRWETTSDTHVDTITTTHSNRRIIFKLKDRIIDSARTISARVIREDANSNECDKAEYEA